MRFGRIACAVLASSGCSRRVAHAALEAAVSCIYSTHTASSPPHGDHFLVGFWRRATQAGAVTAGLLTIVSRRRSPCCSRRCPSIIAPAIVF